MTKTMVGSVRCDGLEGVEDELVLKDEISGSDESDSASIQILDEANVRKDNTGRIRRHKAQKVPSTKLCANPKGNVPPLDELASADDDSFVVDTEAVEDEANNSAYQQDQEGTTSSNFNFSQVISHHTPVPKEPRRSGGGGSTKRNSASEKACFNCGAIGHELFKCPEPRDTRRISQNRNSFSKRRESAGSRFHEQCQGPQPGVISNQLRDALGIGLRVLPPWIYRMRQLGLLNGYPPAYRKRATEQLTVKFHMEDETTSTVGGRRKRKHAETTGEDEQCRVRPEKLIRYSGFNYEADDYVDFDAQQWLIPPWDTFVQAQQHYIDQHLASINAATDGTVEENAADNNGPVNKRHKTVADVDVERIEKLGAEDEQLEEVEEEEETDDDAVDEPDKDVLFVDASRTLSKKKGNVTLEEGEIVDESEAETDLDLRKLNSKNIDDNVTVRKSKKTTTKKLRKKRKMATVPNTSSDDVPPPSPPQQKQKVPDAMAPPNSAEGGGVHGGVGSPSTSKNDGDVHHEQLGEQQQQEPMVVLEMQLGTHVPLNRLSVEKPPLENWAIGIQAFQHQPPSTSSGFFKRMHQIVKSVRKSDGGD